ncbi:helix-turn-helix protein [Ochrobactrum sp. BH3]|nr:helix-turn-helix protein [Ochrobactrum sp. BH3]
MSKLAATEDISNVKGAFEAFRCNWLLQIAADPDAKSAMPVAAVLACSNLNRKNGLAWPSVNFLAEATGVKSHNTIRAALKMLEAKGHAKVKWTKGGRKSTNLVMPVVDGKPFKSLKGFDDENPSISQVETLQKDEQKPFKKLKGNLLNKPLEEPIECSGGLRPTAADHSLDNNSDDTRRKKCAPSNTPKGVSDALFKYPYNVGDRLQFLNEGLGVVIKVGVRPQIRNLFICVRLDETGDLAIASITSSGALEAVVARPNDSAWQSAMQIIEWEKRDAA